MSLMPNIHERRAICMDHGGTVQTVKVCCMYCGKEAKAVCDHDVPNAVVWRRHFRRWQVRGAKGWRKTLCPTCKPKK